MKKVIKIAILFLLTIALNILFSNKLYAFEWSTKILNNKIVTGDEFCIEITFNYNAFFNNAYLDIESDSEYIEIVKNSDGTKKTTTIEDGKWGKWVLKYHLKAKKSGISKVKITGWTKLWDDKKMDEQELNISITINKSEEEINIESAQNYNTNIQDAYKTIPSENANAEEIRDFVSSDVTYNNRANLNSDKISIELLKKWQVTIDAKSGEEHDADKKRYDLVSAYLLNCRLKKEGKQNSKDSLESSIKNSTETAVDANNKTIESAQKKLATIISGPKDASRTETVFTNDVLDDPSAYNPTDPSSKEDSEAATIIDKILSLITTIGTVISVLMLAILGVKYMLGSVEEKAEYKKDLVPYFIGAALLFGICTVVKILQSLGDTINNL